MPKINASNQLLDAVAPNAKAQHKTEALIELLSNALRAAQEANQANIEVRDAIIKVKPKDKQDNCKP